MYQFPYVVRVVSQSMPVKRRPLTAVCACKTLATDLL